MSRSRKKVAHSTWCIDNHGAQSKHYTSVRRRYRRTCKQHLRNNWHNEDMIIPDTKEFYDPWYSPGDGCFVWFYPPEPTNPYDYQRIGMWSSKLDLIEDMLEKDAKNLCQYEKYLRK